MTIASVRIYYFSHVEERERKLTFSHWSWSEWFNRRLKPIREELRGPEVKGINIVNLVLGESADYLTKVNQWWQRGNTFEYNFECDLRPLLKNPPIENIPKLMKFYSHVAQIAPWPQVRALSHVLNEPLSEIDKLTLAPFLQFPVAPPISEAKARKLILKAT
jgi:hypothetical protein